MELIHAVLLFAYLGIGVFHIFLVENVFFAVLGKIQENALDKLHCFGVSVNAASVSFPVLHRLLLVVIFAVVRFCRRDLIAYALDGVFIRHHRRGLTVGVEPILYVMLVAPLVMQPCEASARFAPAYTDR